jgi:aspartate aminotransferase
MEFSANIARLKPSATIALSTRAKELIAEGKDVINLTAGEPDFPTPAPVSEAGIRAIREGRTRYTPSAGIPELRRAIAEDLHRLSPTCEEIDPAGIVVTSGAKQALFNLCFCLFGPGDRVMVPVPYWTTYPELVELARAEPVLVPGDPARGFKITPHDLEAHHDPAVRGLMLNSPGNPTGAVYSLDELEAIARWAAERGIWILSDEIYRRIYLHGEMAPGLLDLPRELRGNAAVVDGASKAFAMTGWRIGFSYTAPELAAKMTALQSQTTSQAATPAQYAALAAYQARDEGLEPYHEMARAFRSRLRRVVELFRERLPGVGFIEPEGAFYLFFEAAGLARPGESAAELCARLLDEVGVALVPGEAFGDGRYVRLSYACSEETLERAVERLAGTLARST